MFTILRQHCTTFSFHLNSVTFCLVSHRLATPISQLNFRANIVVCGSKPFEEDHWKSIRFWNPNDTSTSTSASGVDEGPAFVEMAVVKPCSRCTVPYVDPNLGVPYEGKELPKLLKEMRTGAKIGIQKKEWQREVRVCVCACVWYFPERWCFTWMEDPPHLVTNNCCG